MSVQVLAEPSHGELLSFDTFFCVDAVVCDALNCNEFLDSRGSSMCGNRMLSIVEQFLMFRNDKELGAALATIDVFDGGVVHQFLPNRLALQTVAVRVGLGVTDLPSCSIGCLLEDLLP